jgi:hypothetical protein
MDVTNVVFCKSEERGVSQILNRWGVNHRLSLYTDDGTMFLCPDGNELAAAKSLLQLFGDASGLIYHLNNCAIALIACSEVDVPEMITSFPCQLVSFPCNYMGLPLSL